MTINFDDHLGTFVASDTPLTDNRLLYCDGRVIQRSDYPELFEAIYAEQNIMRLPDCRGVLPGKLWVYVIARPYWDRRARDKDK